MFQKIDKIKVLFRGKTVGYLTLTPDSHLCAFEYTPDWLSNGFSISPLELPLKSGLFIAKPEPFYGNFGIFEDSLPDGYGRYLLHKALMREGINDSNLSSLERLSIIGTNGMGALEYIPESKLIAADTETNLDLLQAKALQILSDKADSDAELLLFNSGNSGGARPKAMINGEDGKWLVKFRHTYDPLDIGISEFKYNETARNAGIFVPDFKLLNNKYFASKRFDITPEGERVHIATAGALLGISLSTPILDYSNLLALTAYLTQDPQDIAQMYRRMIFNYVAGNKDDHCKNFSFFVDKYQGQKWKWRLAPAYDLTPCNEGYNGEHATSVNGHGNPAVSDFIIVGKKVRIKEEYCRRLIQEVREACKDIAIYDIPNM